MQLSEAGDRLSENVRFLLWKEGVPREQWAAYLQQRLRGRIDSTLIERLVRGCGDDVLDTAPLADFFGEEEERLRFADLVVESGKDRLVENLKALIGILEHGGKKALARRLDVDPTTISRWLSGSARPQPATLREVASRFGLPAGTDLTVEAIFLSEQPVSEPDRRKWVHERIDALPADVLRDLFPALKRLFAEP